MVIVMLMRICKCGRRIPQGQVCSCQKQRHKVYDDSRRDKEKQEFYSSTEWKKVASAVKTRANGLDEYLIATGIIELGSMCHHIYSIEERPDLKTDLNNLIYVSARTHNKIHAEYSKGEAEKKAMQKILSERRNYHGWQTKESR